MLKLKYYILLATIIITIVSWSIKDMMAVIYGIDINILSSTLLFVVPKLIFLIFLIFLLNIFFNMHQENKDSYFVSSQWYGLFILGLAAYVLDIGYKKLILFNDIIYYELLLALYYPIFWSIILYIYFFGFGKILHISCNNR